MVIDATPPTRRHLESPDRSTIMRTAHITKATTAQEIARAEARGETYAADLAGAHELAPWAAEIVEVDGGWIAFESMSDAETWAKQ